MLLGFGVEALRFLGLEFRCYGVIWVWGLGSRVEGSGIQVDGSGLCVCVVVTSVQHTSKYWHPGHWRQVYSIGGFEYIQTKRGSCSYYRGPNNYQFYVGGSSLWF